MLTHFKSQLDLQVELHPGDLFYAILEAGKTRNIV